MFRVSATTGTLLCNARIIHDYQVPGTRYQFDCYYRHICLSSNYLFGAITAEVERRRTTSKKRFNVPGYRTGMLIYCVNNRPVWDMNTGISYRYRYIIIGSHRTYQHNIILTPVKLCTRYINNIYYINKFYVCILKNVSSDLMVEFIHDELKIEVHDCTVMVVKLIKLKKIVFESICHVVGLDLSYTTQNRSLLAR